MVNPALEPTILAHLQCSCRKVLWTERIFDWWEVWPFRLRPEYYHECLPECWPRHTRRWPSPPRSRRSVLQTGTPHSRPAAKKSNFNYITWIYTFKITWLTFLAIIWMTLSLVATTYFKRLIFILRFELIFLRLFDQHFGKYSESNWYSYYTSNNNNYNYNLGLIIEGNFFCLFLNLLLITGLYQLTESKITY